MDIIHHPHDTITLPLRIAACMVLIPFAIIGIIVYSALAWCGQIKGNEHNHWMPS